MEYEPVIGLEVHVQLETRTKVFCGCLTDFGAEPNTQVCPVCLGFPGSLPVLNKTALEYSIKVGLALNCAIQGFTKFDRKHYYYPDLPKNIQISQYDLPIAKDGYLDIGVNGQTKRIGIRRAHLEEDAGKLIHRGNASLVDYNRTGQPLLEIVSEPDISAPEEAYEYLTDLKSVVEYLDVSDCDMEKGSLRCDANISVRPRGTKELGTKSEIKNLNSFKAVRDALQYEINRHLELKAAGEQIVQETRLWDEKETKTLSMRSKEEAKDYRYFPEPDLPPFTIDKSRIGEIRKTIPELPKEKMRRFMKDYGLTLYDARLLVISKNTSLYAEERLKAFPSKDKKPVANWLIGPMAQEANSRNKELADIPVSPAALNEIIGLVESGQISNLAAKTVLTEMIDSGKNAGTIVREKNLVQISDESALATEMEAVIKENPKVVGDFKAGKENSIMFLVGQVMKRTKGKANPKIVRDMLKRRLTDA
ncbi:MAG: Asp-tRNA(Asn)/Glu-tRNA(Gln) amidotransferase subunit GatB [Candidatus Omnitrophica bacterium]|nr:Asp-tRNA(Asn)/Glu-tRNA(Gln) amidotransferase subunit GatB [Candidatus Omnitrophota bacterium]